MWPGEHVADVLCVGKALGGGLPLSAALFVRRELADAWRSGPDEVYTHTHVGSPLACAAALVLLEEVPKLLPRVGEASARFAAAGWQGAGLLRTRRLEAADAVQRGVLVIPIPATEPADSLSQAAPPLTITDQEIDEALEKLSA